MGHQVVEHPLACVCFAPEAVIDAERAALPVADDPPVPVAPQDGDLVLRFGTRTCALNPERAEPFRTRRRLDTELRQPYWNVTMSSRARKRPATTGSTARGNQTHT